MNLWNRARFAFLTCVAIAMSGCSGGGGGTPHTSPTASPSPVATPTPVATATPTPTPTPTPASMFVYSGPRLETFTYYGTTPNPSGTILYAVTQDVNDEGTASFDGATANEVETKEVASSAQTITTTTKSYFGSAPYGSSGQTGSYTYGYTSLDSNGQSITDKLAGVTNGNGLIDVLPETAGTTWTNDGAAQLNETESDGFTAARTIAANGTYSENDTYPASASSSASLSDAVDGSGTYAFEFLGSPTTISYAAPASGKIQITYDAGSGTTALATVATWYSLPLYSETDTDRGSTALPSGCNVPSAYGTSGNAIEQKYTKVDTVAGTLETFDQVTYDVGGYAVCTTLNDTTNIFYDYSGQGEQTQFGFDFSGGTSPVEVAKISSTIGLASTTASGAFRNRAAQAATAARVSALRTNFLALVERRRLERRHRAAQHLRTLTSKR